MNKFLTLARQLAVVALILFFVLWLLSFLDVGLGIGIEPMIVAGIVVLALYLIEGTT